MNVPDDRRYSKQHEWISVDGLTATIGVTDYAQEQLGDIVYVELPEVGEQLTLGETFGVLESVKAVSDCFAPASGKVTEINTDLSASPETLNDDCYGEGWMVRIELAKPSEVEKLMDHVAYQAFIVEESR